MFESLIQSLSQVNKYHKTPQYNFHSYSPRHYQYHMPEHLQDTGIKLYVWALIEKIDIML